MCSHSRPILSFFVGFIVSIIMLSSEWLYCPTVQCYTMCSLGLCNCLHVPENKV